MAKPNVVIDTNVFVAALKSKRGAAYKFLICLAEDLYQPNVSVPLFLEYEAVLKRPGLLVGLSESDVDDILNYFLSRASLRKIFYLWRPYLRDPKDDMVLEVAVESRSEYLITFNKKDFHGVDKFGMKVLTPLEFLQERGVLK